MCNRITGDITQIAVKGGFSVEDLNDANIATNPLNMTIGSQNFTIPASNLRPTNTVTNLPARGQISNGIAYAIFNFSKSTFTLVIKNTNFAANPGDAIFDIDVASFTGNDEVSLP